MQAKIEKAIKDSNYRYYGLRYADEYFELQCSRRWELGEPTESELSGLSVIKVTINTIEQAFNSIRLYSTQGDCLFLLGSNEAYIGEDFEELVLDTYSHKLVLEL